MYSVGEAVAAQSRDVIDHLPPDHPIVGALQALDLAHADALESRVGTGVTSLLESVLDALCDFQRAVGRDSAAANGQAGDELLRVLATLRVE